METQLIHVHAAHERSSKTSLEGWKHRRINELAEMLRPQKLP